MCFLAALTLAGAVAGSTFALARAVDPPVSALAGTAAADAAATSADVQSLADAVARWNDERPTTGPGTPFTAQARDLLANVGRARDTMSAFRTARGSVCYQIRAAGTCGRVDTGAGITFALLSTRVGGTRLFGVAADHVVQVSVEIEGRLSEAILRNNGFYFELPEGASSADVGQVTAVWSDGSTHALRGPS